MKGTVRLSVVTWTGVAQSVLHKQCSSCPEFESMRGRNFCLCSHVQSCSEAHPKATRVNVEVKLHAFYLGIACTWLAGMWARCALSGSHRIGGREQSHYTDWATVAAFNCVRCLANDGGSVWAMRAVGVADVCRSGHCVIGFRRFETTQWCRNVGGQLSSDAASYCGRTAASACLHRHSRLLGGRP
jgi:hypothetical protein